MEENICCNKLEIVSCGDTDEHCHLVCGYSKAILTNDTVKNQCIDDFGRCILQNEPLEVA